MGAIIGTLVNATITIYIGFTGMVYETSYLNPNNGPYMVKEIQHIGDIEIDRVERMK